MENNQNVSSVVAQENAQPAMKKVEVLKQAVDGLLKEFLISSEISLNELTVVVAPEHIETVMLKLRDNKATDFEQCIDMCGVDYSEYGNNYRANRVAVMQQNDYQESSHDYQSNRFAVVYHLLSITKNWRIRVRCFLADENFPVIKSLVDVWTSLNWLEREAFDLFGIVFEGHPDLRRILTDYGFIGHPFRKDFPLSGYVEMRYDEQEKRVVYQPVTIEPREITPRVIREESYNGRY